jgi:hypothetical protein
VDKLMEEIMLQTGCTRGEAREAADQLIVLLTPTIAPWQIKAALERVRAEGGRP